MNRLHSALMGVLFLLGLAYPIMAAILVGVGAFAATAMVVLIFLGLFSIEKLLAMFFVIRTRYAPKIGTDWSMVATGSAYTAVLYGALAEFLLGPKTLNCLAVFGIVAALASVAIRYAAIRQLRHSEKTGAGALTLIAVGPFRYVRHPIYFAACVEAVALPMVCHAPFAAVFAVVVFIPLQIHRACLEERVLRETFSDAYAFYAERTPMICPFFVRRLLEESNKGDRQ